MEVLAIPLLGMAILLEILATTPSVGSIVGQIGIEDDRPFEEVRFRHAGGGIEEDDRPLEEVRFRHAGGGAHRPNRPKPGTSHGSHGSHSSSGGTGYDYSGPYNGSAMGNFRELSAEEHLLKSLFRAYSSDARAGLDSSQTVTVEIQYVLLRIQSLDERTQVLTTVGLVLSEWYDERLTWEPLNYGNITEIVVPPPMIWLPELTLMNGADNMAHDFDRMGVIVSNDGKVHWEPGGIFTTTCDIDITYFPFDSQECSVIVGAWAYYTQRMNLTNATSYVTLKDYSVNGAWDILRTEVKWGETELPCCPGITYAYVQSSFYLRRRVKYYFVNIMLPCFMLSVLVLVAFCIPPEAGEKISCGISVLLAFTVFLLMVSETVPKTSLQMPIIAIYLMTTMMLGATSLTLSIMVLNVHHSKFDRPVPRWIQVFILTLLAGVLCMRTGNIRHRTIGVAHLSDSDDTAESSNSEREANARSTKNKNAHRKERLSRSIDSINYPLPKESLLSIFRDVPYIYHVPDWRDVSRVLDRLFFCLVLLAMLVSSALTLASPYYNS